MKNILSMSTMLLMILMSSCKKDDFVEIDGVCPVVISTIPTNGALNVPLDQVISVTFNEEMNAATINDNSFTVNGSLPVLGTIVYQGTTASFTPTSPLTPNTTYTGKVTTKVKDKNGNALQTDYIWTFSTGDILSPMVIITDPYNLESNVNINKVIMATFNMPMDALTLNSNTFKISQGGTVITGSISYTGVTASFTPSTFLNANTTYTAVLTTSIKNPAGFSLGSDYVWTFTTGSDMAPMVISTDPSSNAIDVGLNKIVTATFSEALNASTVNSSSFTLRKGAILLTGIVTYSGTTATFTPDEPFLPGTVYTGTISKSVTNIGGIHLTEDYIWSFTTETGTAPIVIATDPKANEIDVVINKTITATFSEFMNSTTINNTTFFITQGTNKITGTVTYSGTTASFNPNTNLLPGTTYTATITTGAKNGSGISMANDYIWNFTTGSTIAPTIISTDPANNATNVNTNVVVKAMFSIIMDASTLNDNTFTLKNGPNKIKGTVTYAGTTASFTPSTNLSSGTTYTATITTGAKNIAGTPIATDYIWVFSTGASLAPTVISTDPANNATGVNLSKTVTATFSTAMDQNSINVNTFTLKNGATPVAGVITYSGTTASFNPTGNLLSGTIYTATLTTGVKNTSGTALAENFVWTFTTAVAVPPTIVATNPVNNETGVNPNKTITALFSEAMNQSTINGNTFILKEGQNLIAGSVTYSGSTASFNPTADLLESKIYTATITTGAMSLSGIPLANNYVWSFKISDPVVVFPPLVNLGSAARFGILAGVGVSNNAGFSIINNLDVGISPGVRSSVTGFPPATITNGAIFASDDASPPGVAAMLIAAKQSLTGAYLFAEGASTPAPATVSGDIGGTTLAPGIYKSTSTLAIQSGNLTLDANGNANAVWIFQIASGFTTVGGAGGSIILAGGANADNIFWQVGSSATIGDFTSFYGNILALTSITMNSGATATGRMLCINGAIVMTSTNYINRP